MQAMGSDYVLGTLLTLRKKRTKKFVEKWKLINCSFGNRPDMKDMAGTGSLGPIKCSLWRLLRAAQNID